MHDEQPKHGDLELALYAAVMAHLRHFPPKKGPEVLAQLGVADQWPAAKRGFDALLIAEGDEGQDRWLKRFGEAYCPVKEQLAAERPELKDLKPLVANALVAADELPSASSAAAPAPSDSVSDPSPAPPPTQLSPLLQEAGPVPAFAPLPLFVGPSRSPEPPREEGAAAPAPPSFVRSPRVGDTADISSALPAILRALPFAGNPSAATPPTPPTPTPAAPKTSVPTGTADLSAALPRAAVPFAGPQPQQEASPRPRTNLDTVQGYAALAAELSVHWAHAPAVLARHGLSLPEQKAALDRMWNERFQRDPALRAEWQALFERYLVWFRAGGRSGP